MVYLTPTAAAYFPAAHLAPSCSPSSSLAVTADSFREGRGSGPEGTSTGATIWEGGRDKYHLENSENSICKTPTWAMKSQNLGMSTRRSSAELPARAGVPSQRRAGLAAGGLARHRLPVVLLACGSQGQIHTKHSKYERFRWRYPR